MPMYSGTSFLAGVIYKEYDPGDNLSAAELQFYVMNQTVMEFASATARDTALTAVVEQGMLAYLQDVDQLTIYDGTSWIRYASNSDIAAADTRSTLVSLYGSA